MHNVTHVPQDNEYRVHLEQDYFAIVKYELRDDKVIAITHTRVPDELQGKGYGKVMMEAVLAEIEKLELTIDPVCPYVKHFLNKNNQYSHLLLNS